MVQQLFKGAILSVQDEININVNYYFDVISEHSINLTSQITDNWMENNTPIADHIANAPLVINLRGLSGEVVYMPSTTEKTIDNFLTSSKLGVISQILPPVDNITQLAKNTISYGTNATNRYLKIVDGLISPITQIRLKEVFGLLNRLRESKTALTVETPYRNFKNLYIQSLILRQGNQNYITDIELSLKQVYFSETQTTQADEKVVADIQKAQRAEIENHGKTQGANVTDSMSYTWWGNGAAYTNYKPS